MKKKHRTGVVNPEYNGPRMLFAYTDDRNKLRAVIDAQSLSDAWVIATGWGNMADIDDRIARGWRLTPCMVEWETDE